MDYRPKRTLDQQYLERRLGGGKDLPKTPDRAAWQKEEKSGFRHLPAKLKILTVILLKNTISCRLHPKTVYIKLKNEQKIAPVKAQKVTKNVKKLICKEKFAILGVFGKFCRKIKSKILNQEEKASKNKEMLLRNCKKGLDFYVNWCHNVDTVKSCVIAPIFIRAQGPNTSGSKML